MGRQSGNIFRMTISVPLDLKARMDDASETVNWSATACRAFEEKLAEIASRKKSDAMEDVVQKLRAKLSRANDESYAAGEELGKDWVKSDWGDIQHVKRLEAYQKRCGREWDDVFEDVGSSAYSLAERLFFVLEPDQDGGRSEANDFWEEAVGENHWTLTGDLQFLKGFCEGALAFWAEVQEQL